MEVEFWSTSFAAPKPANTDLGVELEGNYPPMPLLSGKKRFETFYSFPVTPSLTRFGPRRRRPPREAATHACTAPRRR
jgi:hypothetical protein